MDNKDHNIGFLAKRLMQEGIVTARTIPGAKETVHYWIKAGRLKLRQRPHTDWNIVSDSEIEQIIKEFSVGGSGRWYNNGEWKK